MCNSAVNPRGGGCVHRVEHILGNLVMQLLLGIPLELVHKGFEVGMVYLAGVLAGEPPLYKTPTPLVHCFELDQGVLCFLCVGGTRPLTLGSVIGDPPQRNSIFNVFQFMPASHKNLLAFSHPCPDHMPLNVQNPPRTENFSADGRPTQREKKDAFSNSSHGNGVRKCLKCSRGGDASCGTRQRRSL